MEFNMKKCCMPFPTKRCSKNLRKLTEQNVKKLKFMGKTHLDTSLMICDNCRLHLNRTEQSHAAISEPSEKPSITNIMDPQPSTSRQVDLYGLEETPSAISLMSVPSDSSVQDYSRRHNIELFNKGVAGINVSPISAKKFLNVNYARKKFKDVSNGIRTHIFGDQAEEDDLEQLKVKAAEYDEIIAQLKDRYADPETSRDDQVRILSVLPQSWTNQRVMAEFGITNKYIVSQAKFLAKHEGVLAAPNEKLGHGLNPEIKNQILQFYDSDEITRATPGMNDYVSVRSEGKRVHIQKRLLVCSLREAFIKFQEMHQNAVGFSSFAALRPKHCKLLGSTGSHNICVCTIHENINLMLHGLRKYSFENDYKLCFEEILCSSSTRTKKCYLRECERCPGFSDFESSLTDKLEKRGLVEISFEQWISTDRCSLETLVKPIDEFIAYFCEKLEQLVSHDFVKSQQSSFLRDYKSCLKDGAVIIICDFSENYSFVFQDAVQSSYWSNEQATIHPFVIYYTESGILKNISFIVISEVLKHDTIAVQVFISKLISFLQTKIKVKKATFMSDGAASQYKNRKNFASLCKFKKKYNIDAEWHFFATSHGKGPCDAIGGTLKRMARYASLAVQHEHPIKSALELFEWANQKSDDCLTKMSFCYVSHEEYEQGVAEWNEIYRQTKTIAGTQKYHSFVPISENEVFVKLFSNDEEGRIHNIYKSNQ